MAEGPSLPTEISSSPDDPVIRILLMGRNGSGKSSSGNTILGERKFKVQKHKRKHEADVCEEVTQIGEKQVHVINSPDLLDPDLSKKKFESLQEQLVCGCSAGLSSVLLTVPLEEPVKNEEEILEFIKCLFGPGVQKYIMILFTRGDELQDQDETIDEHLQHKDHEDLQRLVTECGGRFHCFNNKRSDDQKQELLQKIEGMMEENGGKFIMKQRSSSMGTLYVNFSRKSPADVPEDIDEIPERKDLRLVLLGKTGSGKSATGNTIIGRNVLKSTASTNSQTKQCQSETTVRMGKEISVIDTPGLYDTELSEEDVMKEIVKCITYASPGPHAFIIVIKVSRFTEEQKNTVEKLEEMFGEKIVKYTMIIFTHKDELEENETIEQYLENCDPDLQKLIQSCGNRFFCLDNKSASFPQFRDLISRIEKMVEENGGTHFTNDMFEETENCIQEIQKVKLDEKVKQYKLKNQLATKIECKLYWSLTAESREDSLKDIINLTCLYVSAVGLERKCTNPEFVLIEETKSIINTMQKLAKENMCVTQ